MPSLFLALALLSAAGAVLWRAWYIKGPRIALRALPILFILAILWALILTGILSQIF